MQKRHIPGRFEPVQIELQTDRKSEGIGRTKSSAVDAFIPDLLPPKLDLPALHFDVYDKLIEAERAVSLLEGSAHRLPNPHILIGPFSRKEAILSSAIEDTFATIEDLARVEANLAPEDGRDDAREVRNYVRALDYGLASELPISLRLIRELHRILMEDTRGRSLDPGRFRRIQNYIGREGQTPRFVPPPVNHLDPLLANLEHFVHSQTRIPELVRIAAVHYQFEAIHPFLDGNGRVGRLLVTLQLCQRSLLTKPLIYVSGYFEKHRAEYYDRLLAVSQHGQWIEWFTFFLSAVASQASDARRRADDFLLLQQQWHQRVRMPRASGLLPTIVDGLFSKQWLTISEVAQQCHVTQAAARSLVTKLESLGILKEMTGQSYGRVWFAPEIFDVIRKEYEEQQNQP